MSAYRIICITGPDGSGKSTLIDALEKTLPGAIVTTIWDLMKEPSMQHIVPFKKPQDVDAYLAALHPAGRSLFLMHCLTEAFETAKEKEPAYILTDSYWYKYYATELAHGTPKKYLDKLVSRFEQPDFVFYLNADEQLTSGRKQKFSRYECGFASELNDETFREFQTKSIPHLRQLMQSTDHIQLDAGRSCEENCTAILHLLKP